MKNLIKVLLVLNLIIWIITTGLIFTAAFSKERIMPNRSSVKETTGVLQTDTAVDVNQFAGKSDNSGASSSNQNIIRSFYTISKIPQYIMLIITILFFVTGSTNNSKIKKDLKLAEERNDEEDLNKIKSKMNQGSTAMSVLTVLMVASITILIVQSIIFRMMK